MSSRRVQCSRAAGVLVENHALYTVLQVGPIKLCHGRNPMATAVNRFVNHEVYSAPFYLVRHFFICPLSKKDKGMVT